MSLHYLRMLPLLILGFALPFYAQTNSSSQSLADIARQTRAEVEHSATHPRVITNEDLEPQHEAAPAKSEEESAAPDESAKDEAKAEGENNASADNGKQETSKEAKKSAKPNPEKLHQQQEAETQKRTDEINRQYIDRIRAIEAKINDAQKAVARLQRDQTESNIAFERGVGTNPSIPQYQEQQRLFNDQIEAQRQSIADLTSELEDARESARHAGVPHADEY